MGSKALRIWFDEIDGLIRVRFFGDLLNIP